MRFEAQTLEQHPLAYLLGLQVRRCEEPRRPCPLVDDGDLRSATGEEFPEHVPDAPPNIWALHRWCPAATNAAYRDSPAAVIWHFQLDAGNGGGT